MGHNQGVESSLALKGNTNNFNIMEVNVQFVKMVSSETMAAYNSKKPEKLTEAYDWIINADVYFKLKKRLGKEQ